MYVNAIVLIYPSSHLSVWLTISLFYKSVSVFFCGNMFIGSNLRLTCVNDTIGYLSFPFDLLNLIWLFLGSSAVLKTTLFIFSRGNYSIRYVYRFFFVHLSVDGHFVCLHVLAIVNIAAVHVCLCVLFLFWCS